MDDEEGAGTTYYIHTPYVCVYIYVCIYLLMGRMTKSLEKSLRPEITLGHRTTQKMGLQNPEVSGCHSGQGAGRRGHSPPWVLVQSSSGRSESGPDWLRASAGALYDIHVFKLLIRSQTGRVFLLKQQLFSVSGSPLKQKTGLFVDPLLTNSVSSRHRY